MYLCAVWVCALAVVHMWKSENNLWVLRIKLRPSGGSKCFYLLSHLNSPPHRVVLACTGVDFLKVSRKSSSICINKIGKRTANLSSRWKKCAKNKNKTGQKNTAQCTWAGLYREAKKYTNKEMMAEDSWVIRHKLQSLEMERRSEAEQDRAWC